VGVALEELLEQTKLEPKPIAMVVFLQLQVAALAVEEVEFVGQAPQLRSDDEMK